MRFKVDPRDVPAEAAARRLGVAVRVFLERLPNLIARGFPAPDPDTGNFDLDAVDRWCDGRHPHLFGALSAPAARDAKSVVAGRIAALEAERGG